MSDLTDTREKTHGDFRNNASVAQELRAVFRAAVKWHELPSVQREALDNIATKLSRILGGNYDHVDHWDDIAGYAELAAPRAVLGSFASLPIAPSAEKIEGPAQVYSTKRDFLRNLALVRAEAEAVVTKQAFGKPWWGDPNVKPWWSSDWSAP